MNGQSKVTISPSQDSRESKSEYIYVRNLRPRYMLEDGVIALRLTAAATDLAIFENIETYYRTHTASYPMGTAGSYPERKAVSM